MPKKKKKKKKATKIVRTVNRNTAKATTIVNLYNPPQRPRRRNPSRPRQVSYFGSSGSVPYAQTGVRQREGTEAYLAMYSGLPAAEIVSHQKRAHLNKLEVSRERLAKENFLDQSGGTAVGQISPRQELNFGDGSDVSVIGVTSFTPTVPPPITTPAVPPAPPTGDNVYSAFPNSVRPRRTDARRREFLGPLG